LSRQTVYRIKDDPAAATKLATRLGETGATPSPARHLLRDRARRDAMALKHRPNAGLPSWH
jgi:hypothetical protein